MEKHQIWLVHGTWMRVGADRILYEGVVGGGASLVRGAGDSEGWIGSHKEEQERSIVRVVLRALEKRARN